MGASEVLCGAMRTMKHNAYMLTVCLLLWLLPGSMISTSAMSSTDWKKNMKVGIELRGGVPYGSLMKGNEEFKGSFKDLEVNSNWQFGVVEGYSFPAYGNALAIGPEVGVLLGPKNMVKFSQHDGDYLLQERYLYIPFALKLAAFKRKTGVQESGLILGYELRVLLSSQLHQAEGSSNSIFDSDLKDVERIAKSLKRGGNIFLEGRVDVFKGFYLTGRFKFPITDFSALKKVQQEQDNKKKGIHALRALSESFVEIGIGINIMKWFLADT